MAGPCVTTPAHIPVGFRRLASSWLPALLFASACTHEGALVPEPGGLASVPRVVVLSIDGLRADAIREANAKTLMRLVNEGAASLSAQTVLPSNTLPAHTSMLTGLVPSRHGITFNDDLSSDSPPLTAATVFDLASTAGYTTAMFAGKSKLRIITHPAAPTDQSIPSTGEVWLAEKIAVQVLAYLKDVRPRPNLLFIHLPDVDLAGHEFGWRSPEYFAAVRKTDDAVTLVVEALRTVFGANLTLIVTADHGGVGRGHYEGSLESTTIPWIAWGRGVRARSLPGVIHVADTAPTTLWLLKIPQPAGLDGVAVKQAFDTVNAGTLR